MFNQKCALQNSQIFTLSPLFQRFRKFKTNKSFDHFQSDTLNPFETNNNNLDDSTDASLERKEQYCNNKITKDDENNIVLTNAQMTLLEDQRQELADLKRQVVFLKVSHLKNLVFFNFYVIVLIFMSEF